MTKEDLQSFRAELIKWNVAVATATATSTPTTRGVLPPTLHGPRPVEGARLVYVTRYTGGGLSQRAARLGAHDLAT